MGSSQSEGKQRQCKILYHIQCFVSVFRAGEGAVSNSSELVLRTSVWLLKVLGPCSFSVNTPACPLLINQIPPVSDKFREGQKSQINFFKMGSKSVAEQRKATQANTLRRERKKLPSFSLSLKSLACLG